MILTEAERTSSGLRVRTISALVLAPVILGIIIVGKWLFVLFLLAAFAVALWEWRRMTVEKSRPVLHMAAGAAYLGICFLSFGLLRLDFPDGAWWAIGLMLTVWASDCGAYFSGKTFGGPKLAPRISPKKTWSGFTGAVFSAGIVLCLFSLQFVTVLHPLHFFVTGMVLGAVGQTGDLLESLYKRRSGLKDSGCLIPGHGGLLDRIDALLLASPVFLLFVWGWLQ